MGRIVIDVSDLEWASRELAGAADRLVATGSRVASRVGATYLNYRDPTIRRSNPREESRRVAYSLRDVADQIDRDVGELRRVIRFAQEDMARPWIPSLPWPWGGQHPPVRPDLPWWMRPLFGWPGMGVRESLPAVITGVGLFKHLAEYSHWFGRTVQPYHSFLGYVDSAKSGLVASLLRAIGLTGNSSWQDALGISGKAIDLGIDAKHVMRKIPGGAHGFARKLGFAGGVLSTVYAASEVTEAVSLLKQGKGGEVDWWEVSGSLLDMGSAVAAIIPGGQLVALTLAGVSLGLDVVEYGFEHGREVVQAAGRAARAVGRAVGDAASAVGDAAGAVGNAVSKGWRKLTGWF